MKRFACVLLAVILVAACSFGLLLKDSIQEAPDSFLSVFDGPWISLILLLLGAGLLFLKRIRFALLLLILGLISIVLSLLIHTGAPVIYQRISQGALVR